MGIKPQKTCLSCQKIYTPKVSHQKFCSIECRDTKQKEKAAVNWKYGSGGGFLRRRFVVFRRDGFKCRYCGRGAIDGTTLHIDHIYPKSKGGDLSLDNLITACCECNQGKGDIILLGRELNYFKNHKSRI